MPHSTLWYAIYALADNYEHSDGGLDYAEAAEDLRSLLNKYE